MTTRLGIEFEKRSPVGMNLNPQSKRHIAAGMAMLEEKISQLGIPGKWHIRANARARHHGDAKLVVSTVLENPLRLVIKVKPGSNDSVWEYHVVPPNGRATTADAAREIGNLLEQNEQKARNWKPAKVARAAIPELRQTNGHPVPTAAAIEHNFDTPKQNDPPVVKHVPAQSFPEAMTGQPKASQLRAALGRLDLILESAERRQAHILDLCGHLEGLQQQQIEIRQVAEREIESLVQSIATLQLQLEELLGQEAADQELLQASEVLSLADELKS